jgi:hypothetical protein
VIHINTHSLQRKQLATMSTPIPLDSLFKDLQWFLDQCTPPQHHCAIMPGNTVPSGGGGPDAPLQFIAVFDHKTKEDPVALTTRLFITLVPEEECVWVRAAFKQTTYTVALASLASRALGTEETRLTRLLERELSKGLEVKRRALQDMPHDMLGGMLQV